ncbi:MAG: TIGR00730 family Rossman fold protein [Mogibacterium sp.]|nr:TIGR00730 family Rossman fold protein [Mogibacterium sp.]
MNITVYCGALAGANPEYARRAKELGEWIAENGHTLVYGAGDAGMMGAVSEGVIEKGGKTIGITPNFFVLAEVTRKDLTEIIISEGMSDRREKMIELGDAFIALPGGTGTLDEISEVAALKRIGKLGEIDKPVMLYNIDGFYDNLLSFFDAVLAEGFFEEEDRASIIEVRNIQDISEVIENAGGIHHNRNTQFDFL